MVDRAKVIGIKRLARKLRDMPGPVFEESTKALTQAADEIVVTMRKLVPVRRAALQHSINWTWGKAPRGSVRTPIGNRKQEAVLTIYAGDETAYYARWVEFGTRPHSLYKGARVARKRAATLQSKGPQHPGARAQPFFFPAYRSHKKEAKRRINTAITKAIRKVAAGGGARV